MNGRQSTGLSAIDAVLIGVAALAVVLGAGLWLWAGTAGMLFGSGWPRLSISVLWHALAGVAAHLSDPRQGFPARLRPGLPGPTGFYLTLALLLALIALVATAAIKLRHRAQPTGLSDSKRHGARWARSRDLTRLRRNRGKTADGRGTGTQTPARATVQGLSLGYRGMRLLRAEDRHALVVFGPTQSGKSAGIAIPNILEWQGPAIVVSIKPDLLDATLTTRAKLGETLVFDPFGLWNQPTNPGRRSPAPRPGTRRCRPRSGSLAPERWTRARSRAAASGPKPPSNASPPCSTPPPAPAWGWAMWCAGSTGRAAPN